MVTASFGLLSITAAMISTCRRSRGRAVGRQLPGMRGHGARLGSLHVELVQAGARDMRQRKAFVFADRPVEGVLGAVPGRQHAIHALAVMRGGAVGGGRQRQIIPVPVHLLFP